MFYYRGLKAVSYTHLDVYKRQVCGTGGYEKYNSGTCKTAKFGNDEHFPVSYTHLDEDITAIEKEMKKIAKSGKKIIRKEISKEEAMEM